MNTSSLMTNPRFLPPAFAVVVLFALVGCNNPSQIDEVLDKFVDSNSPEFEEPNTALTGAAQQNAGEFGDTTSTAREERDARIPEAAADSAAPTAWNRDGNYDLNALACGTRNTTALPPAGHLQITWATDYELAAGDPDGALARMLLPGERCDWNAEYRLERIYEVAHDGSVARVFALNESNGVKTYYDYEPDKTRFTIEGGCLRLGYGDDFSELDSFFAVANPYATSYEGCPGGAIPIYGEAEEDGNAPSACLEMTTMGECLDCGRDADGWFVEALIAVRVVALGSVAGVSNYCGSEKLDITAGESITVNYRMTWRYTPSAAPEALGYQSEDEYLAETDDRGDDGRQNRRPVDPNLIVAEPAAAVWYEDPNDL